LAFVVFGCLAKVLAGEPATAVATVTAGFVTQITVTSGGSGYLAQPAVTLVGGGGSGATAQAVLSGGSVALVIVLTAGNGYTTSPTVTIEAPPNLLGVRLELVPKLTVDGPAGSLARVESAMALAGPWESWTNVAVGAEGVVLVDLRAGLTARFYRAVPGTPSGPAGFVWIPPGSFVMGSPASEADRDSDEVQHAVMLTRGFWLSDHETTQAEYQSIMGSNPSYFKGTDRPVDSVLWSDAVAYCQKLTERERAAGRITAQQEYRLPTESEWEYAARAGTTGARHGELNAIAWFGGNSSNETHGVKGKQANAWGLYDMIGNVREWCGDWYDFYPTGSVTDPTGPVTSPVWGSNRVIRGGGWNFGARDARAARRLWEMPIRDPSSGFRPALSSVR
jgi:formylglycine-generating enzyme required for sulfatase activity